MINRELIRLKVVQLTYAYRLNGTQKLDTAEKELFFSLSKAYDLYMYMLDLMVEVNRMAERAVETANSRYRRLKEGLPPSTKFIDNRFIAQLQSNRQLRDFVENQKKTWADDEDFVRRLYRQIADGDIYKEWMAGREEPTYEQERELWRKIYRAHIVDNEELSQLMEEKSLYWNDDRYIVDAFVMKTIKRFEPKTGAGQQLMPEFRDDEDREFAKRLFRATLLGGEHYRALVSPFLRGWDISRLPVMDQIILETALAEIFTFSQMPVTVSINEYVEITKMYSTPQSGRYINGLLDAVCRQQIQEGKLKKQMPDSRQYHRVDEFNDDAPQAGDTPQQEEKTDEAQ
ncbi:MAG: transcription antitermination protein NusB [Bacteroidaceae bacterium]|nr:transcription antitermination protein NusB [Bacteroidaceae bacterium]